MEYISIAKAVKIKNNRVRLFSDKKEYLATGGLIENKIKTEKVSYKTKPSRADLLVSENQLIVARMKETNKVLVIDKKIEDLIVSTGFLVLKVSQNWLPRFLFHYFVSNFFQDQKNRLSTGATQKAINNTKFKEILIPEISLEDQKRIVKILDKADALRQTRKQSIDHLDKYLKSVFLEMFGDIVSNSMGWNMKALDDLCDIGSSKRVFVSEFKNNGIPFYRGTEIGRLSCGEDIKPTLFITNNHYQELKKYTGVPLIGDLLMPSICPDGRIWLVDTEDPFYFKDGRVLWIHMKAKTLISIFLKHLLIEKFIRDYRSIASGTTFAELKIFALKKLCLILPPIELQNKFSEIDKKIESLKQEMLTQSQELENQFQALLQKAFKGEL